MTLKCTKCGFENQLGSIFCRGCGEKLDTSSLDNHETIDMNTARKKGHSTIALIGLLCILLIIAACVVTIFFVLRSPNDTMFTQSNADTTKIERFMRKGKNVSISTEELSSMFQGFLAEDKIEGIRNVRFRKIEDDKLGFIIYAEWNGRDIVYTLSAKITKNPGVNPPAKIEYSDQKIGYVPMLFFGGIASSAADKILDNKSFKNLTKNAGSMEFKDGNLVITYDK